MDQDWKPVVLSKKVIPKIIPKQENKVEQEEIPKLEFFERSFQIKLSQLRQEKKLTRLELATKLKIRESELADLENVNKKVKYNGAFVHKCKQFFGNFSY